GAVGKFGIAVTADRTEVNAFDPIDLKVVIEGEGLLERVGLPRWHEDKELTRDFDVSTDVDPGRVEDGRKIFGVVLRARSGQVTQIPALPFPYYDPAERVYRVARSAPIPLTVHEVRTIDAAEAVGPGRATGAPVSRGEAPIEALKGIPANYAAPGEVRALVAAERLDGWIWLVLLVPPLLGIAFGAVKAAARVRPAPAPLIEARRTLAAAPGEAGAAYDALAEYGRSRLGLGAGEVTAADLEGALLARGAPAIVVERSVHALEALVALRYAPGTGETPAVLPVIEAIEEALS
ncbi:MAG: hypothetical protein ACYTFT_11295, partial [Planctomycetota bacterium]